MIDSGDEYTEKVQSGVRWLSSSMLATKAASFATSILLARLLAPEAFGLITFAHVTIAMLQVFREVGFGAAYVQRASKSEDDNRRAANTTFWMNCVLNAVLFFAATGAVPAIAGFFNSAAAEDVLRWMFVSFLLDMFILSPNLELQKRLLFAKQGYCEIVLALSFAGISIALANLDFGVWALVYGHLASKFVYGIALYRASGWRPGLEFDKEIGKELFKYGKYLWAFTILSAVGAGLDKIVVGRLYGEGSLGVYGMALLVASFPAQSITALVNRIAFPLFSRMREDAKGLREAQRKSLSYISVLSFPVSLGIVSTAPLFTLALLKPEWAPCVPLIEVLAFYGLLLAVASGTGPYFKAVAKTKVLFYTSVLHHSLKIVLLFALQSFGLIGICYAVLVPMLVSASIAFAVVVRDMEFSVAEFFLPLLRSAVAAGAMYVGVEWFSGQLLSLHGVPPLPALVLSVCAGVLLYAVTSLAVNRSDFMNALLSLKDTVSGRKKLEAARHLSA